MGSAMRILFAIVLAGLAFLGVGVFLGSWIAVR